MFNKFLSVTLISLLVFSTQAAKVGEKATDFSIQSSNDQTFRLSDFKGKRPVYLIFWNTWCPFCIKKMPSYQEVYNFSGDEIEVLAVNTSIKDSYKKMLNFIDRHQLDIPMAFDFGHKISEQYNVTNTPTVFIIDINGVIRYRNNLPEDIDPYIAEWSRVE